MMTGVMNVISPAIAPVLGTRTAFQSQAERKASRAGIANGRAPLPMPSERERVQEQHLDPHREVGVHVVRIPGKSAVSEVTSNNTKVVRRPVRAGLRRHRIEERVDSVEEKPC